MAGVPLVVFTPQLRRFTATPEVQTQAVSLRGALEDAFAANPRLRAYVLDDQGSLRANVMVFVDGQRCDERHRLDLPLQPDSQVHVMQALSGG
jgi:sulfur-carrier protein